MTSGGRTAPPARPVTVLALTPSIGGPYFGEVLAGLTREIASAGGRLVLVQTLDAGSRHDEAGQAPDFATPVAWGEVDGVVAITTAASGPYLQRVRDAGLPVVLTSTRLPDFARRSRCRTTTAGRSPRSSI